ncbi:MAG: SprT family zinc-dependent metalloprotease [Chloroflexota bacterium]
MSDLPLLIQRVIRSKRRTIALIVENDGSVTIRAPMKISGKTIIDFVDKHAQWVEKKQAEIKAIVPTLPKQYQTGESFLYLGQAYPLEIVSDAKKKLVLENGFKLAESAQTHAELVFQNWYRQQARQVIEARAAFFADKYQLHYDKLRITSARTRWGSCSSKGTLSFSWRLILTPLELVDYVVIHELAHTVHHNHSKRFWKLVEKIIPDFKEWRRQLKQYGQQMLS